MDTTNLILSKFELVSTAVKGATSNEKSWLDQMKQRIENRSSGFDPRAVVEECANAAKQGKGIGRGMIFGSLKSAGFGPLLACEQLF